MKRESFLIEHDVLLQAEPSRVFLALCDVGAWWSHHFSDLPTAIHLEAHPGGRFYEEFGVEGGGGALYATVVYIKHGEALRMVGPLGMSGPVLGDIIFKLEPVGEATRLRLSHKVIGDVDDSVRERYDRGWRELLGTRLRDFVEQGIHYSP